MEQVYTHIARMITVTEVSPRSCRAGGHTHTPGQKNRRTCLLCPGVELVRDKAGDSGKTQVRQHPRYLHIYNAHIMPQYATVCSMHLDDVAAIKYARRKIIHRQKYKKNR